MTIKRSTISRRHALGAATAGVGIPILAACGEDDDGNAVASDPESSSSSPSDASSPSAAETTTKAPPAGGIPTADVPVGGGIVVADEQVVVTQPTNGEFKAFTAVCTHRGCVVARVGSEIECDCHGSRFSIESGEVTNGPASAPLAAASITVESDRIILG